VTIGSYLLMVNGERETTMEVSFTSSEHVTHDEYTAASDA
jgi:hypothetical protein